MEFHFPRSSCGVESPLDIQHLNEQAMLLLFNGLAKSTRRTYSAAQRRFLEFCFWSGQVQSGGSPLPASEWTLILFITELSRSLKASSIKVYLSGVRSLHVENGFDNPLKNRPRLEQVLRGIKRSQGLERRPRRPIRAWVLRSLHSLIDYRNYQDVMFGAACCTGSMVFFAPASLPRVTNTMQRSIFPWPTFRWTNE